MTAHDGGRHWVSGSLGSIVLVLWAIFAMGCSTAKLSAPSWLGGEAKADSAAPATASKPTSPPATASRPDASLDPAPVGHLTGSWEGVYYAYPQPMGMKAELRPAGGDLVEGELAFYPLDTKQRNLMGGLRGSYALKGTYDPLTQTFELAPGKWIDKPRGLAFPTTLRGVLSVQREEIAGFLVRGDGQSLPSNTHFVMSRPQQAKGRLTGPMVDAVSTAGRSGLGRLFGGAPSDGDLVKWASQLEAEYPDLDLQNTVLGKISEYARNLFEDEHFRKYFGTTFDQMSPSDRSAVADKFRKANVQQPPRSLIGSLLGGSPDEELKKYSFLAGAFSSSGTDSAAAITLSVLTHRTIRSWRDAMQERMRDWPAEADVFQRLQRIETAGKERLITLWPSEQKRFATELADSRKRLAVPVLNASADRAVAAARGYPGARDLAAWADRNQAALRYASPNDRGAVQGKIDARLDELLQPLLAAETAKLASFGEGHAAVTAGNAWYRDFESRYGFVQDHPRVRDALRQLAQRRGKDLAAAQPYIASRLRGVETPLGVDNTLANWMPVPGDQRTPAGAALAGVATERKQRIDLENKFSDNEIALMKTHLGTVDVPARPAQPTEEEIGLSFLRAIAKLGGEQISRTVGHYTVPPAGSLGVYYIVQLVRIDVLGVAPVGDGSYLCKYAFKAHYSLPDAYLDSFGIRKSPVHMQILNTQLGLMNSMHPTLIDQFVLTSGGWQSPTMKQRGVEAMLTVQRSWAEDLNRAVQTLTQ